MRFASYQTEGYYDEMFEAGSRPRPHAQLLAETTESLSDGQLLGCKHTAERLLLQMGITFNVYGDTAGAERAPRHRQSDHWLFRPDFSAKHTRTPVCCPSIQLRVFALRMIS